MKKIILMVLLLSNLSLCANNYLNKTQALHEEIKNNTNPNIRKETHPILWEMVENLANKARVYMPRYITLHGAQKLILNEENAFTKKPDYILTWVDIWGDLYICYELVAESSYEEIEGLVAIALAQKALWVPLKSGIVGFGSGIFAAAFLKAAMNNLIPTSRILIDNSVYRMNKQEYLKYFGEIAVLPVIYFMMKWSTIYFQKSSDLHATRLTNAENIIAGIRQRTLVEDGYNKEDMFLRILNLLYLKGVWNFFTYPIREYTDEERIAYLENYVKLH